MEKIKDLLIDFKQRINWRSTTFIYIIMILISVIDNNISLQDFIHVTMAFLLLLFLIYLYSKYYITPTIEYERRKKEKEKKEKEQIELVAQDIDKKIIKNFLKKYKKNETDLNMLYEFRNLVFNSKKYNNKK